ncbi:MAG: SDR family oxidoreductase [Actinomycetota bacterium]|jgi:3-oxoacyl-[acyl-carrier protein] reductase/sorbitol-6-phosphate 2-dehydrogenase
MGRLDDRVALVTGGSRGLGEGIARHLAAEGAVVVCADVLDATEVASSLPASPSGRKGKAVHLDVANTAEVDEVIADIGREFGSLDILCNNAGVAQPIAHVVDTPDEVIDKVFSVNVRGVIACTRAASRIMKEQKRGRIVNTASQVGKTAWPDWGVYSASKAAVIGITQVTAVELAPWNIQVNAICPGTMLTNMTRTGMGGYLKGDMTLEQMISDKEGTIPMQRLGTPDDVGNLVVFLASDECSFTTGAAINLTGGEMVSF